MTAFFRAHTLRPMLSALAAAFALLTSSGCQYGACPHCGAFPNGMAPPGAYGASPASPYGTQPYMPGLSPGASSSPSGAETSDATNNPSDAPGFVPRPRPTPRRVPEPGADPGGIGGPEGFTDPERSRDQTSTDSATGSRVTAAVRTTTEDDPGFVTPAEYSPTSAEPPDLDQVQPFLHDAVNFKWFRGILDYDPRSRAWLLVYARKPEPGDPHQGIITLTDHPGLVARQRNEIVRVEGEFDPLCTDPFGNPVFRVTKVSPPLKPAAVSATGSE
jgi:hypothetical protein